MPEGNLMIAHVPVVAYSPNGRWIYPTGGDLAGGLAWDSSTGKLVDTLVSRCDSSIASVAFSPPDSRYILTTGYDGTVRIWPTSTEDLVRLAGSQVPRDPSRLTKAELADPLLEQPTPTARDQTRRP
jgi:WD40 repeat protein